MKILKYSLSVILIPFGALLGQATAVPSMPLVLVSTNFDVMSLQAIALEIQGCLNEDYLLLKAVDRDRAEADEQRFQELHSRCLLESPVGEFVNVPFHIQRKYKEDRENIERQNRGPRSKGVSFLIGVGLGMLSGVGYVTLASWAGWELTATGILLTGTLIPTIFDKKNKIAAGIGGLIGSVAVISGLAVLLFAYW